MPYEIRTEEGQWCVYNKDSGDKKACHDSEEKAEAQVRLLHSLEKDDD
jgi:hypothetical protein